jgi:hypothetical protein
MYMILEIKKWQFFYLYAEFINIYLYVEQYRPALSRLHIQCYMAHENCEKTFENNIFSSSHALDDNYLFLSYTIVSIFLFSLLKTSKHKNHSKINLLHVFTTYQFPNSNLGNAVNFLFLKQFHKCLRISSMF